MMTPLERAGKNVNPNPPGFASENITAPVWGCDTSPPLRHNAACSSILLQLQNPAECDNAATLDHNQQSGAVLREPWEHKTTSEMTYLQWQGAAGSKRTGKNTQDSLCSPWLECSIEVIFGRWKARKPKPSYIDSRSFSPKISRVHLAAALKNPL